MKKLHINTIYMLDQLGDWRKTHYTKDLSPDMEGKEVILGGWVRNYRNLGGLQFISLQDKYGERQITLKKGIVSDELFEKVKIGYQYCLMVKGIVKVFSEAPGGIEIIPSEIKVLNTTPDKLPIDMTGETVSELDLRLNHRALDLRSLKNQAIFEIRGELLRSIRKFLFERDFTEITTPKIIASATEGGTELFPIIYFEKEAFLTQSAQLYKEQLSGVYERVFEISDCFRAEKHRTKRHICEIFTLDVEIAFSTMEDVLKLLEELIHSTIKDIRKNQMSALKYLNVNQQTTIPEIPFPRYRYEEIIDFINTKFSFDITFGEDISTEAYRKLGKELHGYYYITHWPMSIKPFYIMPSKNPKYSESFDLQKGMLELTSGGTRVHEKIQLIKALEEKGLNHLAFNSHLNAFDYGMPPHAGFGLGIDRWLTLLCGLDDIREAVMYPRTPDRLTP